MLAVPRWQTLHVFGSVAYPLVTISPRYSLNIPHSRWFRLQPQPSSPVPKSKPMIIMVHPVLKKSPKHFPKKISHHNLLELRASPPTQWPPQSPRPPSTAHFCAAPPGLRRPGSTSTAWEPNSHRAFFQPVSELATARSFLGWIMMYPNHKW